MKLLSYLAFLSCLEGLAFAVLAYWLNPRKLINRLGAAVGLLNAWWNGCLTVVYGAPDLATALLFDRLSYVSILGLNPMLAWFYLTFAEAPRRWTMGLVAAALAAGAVVAVGYTLGFPRSAFVPGPWGNVAVEAPGNVWSTVSDGVAILLDFVYFGFLLHKRRTTGSWRLKRLVTLILVGIPSAIAAYFVLNAVSQAFGIPGLIFLPGALVVLLHIYVIFQYRFLQNEAPPADRGWGDLLPRAAFLVDKDGRVVGANARARNLDSPLFEGFPAAWDNRAQATPCDIATPHGRLRLSPHFDRFGDFVGAAGIFAEGPDEGTLSPRETEVLNLLVEGLGNKDIGDRLFVSPGTVKRHVHEILAKTGARSRQELVLRFGKAPR